MRTRQHEKARFLVHKNPLFASLALFLLLPSIYTPAGGCLGASLVESTATEVADAGEKRFMMRP
jgi:hypothetical protein